MMTSYDLKPLFQDLLRPLVAIVHRAGVTANIVTIAAAVMSVSFGIWMATDPAGQRLPFLVLPVFLLVRMTLNAMDGMLAREYGQHTKLGAILNETGDLVSDTVLYVPFALLPEAQPEYVVLGIFLSMLSEFVGVLGQVVGDARRYEGPFGKSDRAILFGLVGPVIYVGWVDLPFLDIILDGVMVTAAGLSCRTTWNLARAALGR